MQDRLETSLKVGWGLGSVGPISMMYLISFFAIVYMSTYLGITPTVAGLIIVLTKVINMFTDPIVGIISDRSNSSWGRRRPFMLVGGVLGGGSVALFFNAPQFATVSTTTVYIAVVTILYFTAYTLFNVTYLAMPAEMTDSQDERTSIMTWRVLFASVGGYIGLVIAPYIISAFGQDRDAYGTMGLILGALLTSAMCYTVYATRNTKFTHHQTLHQPLKEQFRTVWENKPFLNIVAAKAFQLIGLSTTTAALPFVAIYIIGGDYTLLAAYGLALNTASILVISQWRKASLNFAKKHLYAFAIIGYALCGLTWWFTGSHEATPLATITFSDNYRFVIPNGMYLLRSMALGIFTAGVLLIGQSMVPDAIAYDYQCSGQRREGTFSAIYSFVEKMALSIGPLIVGAMLDFNGFITSSEGIVEQPRSAISAIYISVAIIPTLASLLAIPFIARYHIPNHEAGVNTYHSDTLVAHEPQNIEAKSGDTI